MNSISIPLREDNFAEVLAGMAILGIVAGVQETTEDATARWTASGLNLSGLWTEEQLLAPTRAFLSSLAWLPSPGGPHLGGFQAESRLGVCPFVRLNSKDADPSIWKTFSGQVTPIRISSWQRQAFSESSAATSFRELLQTSADGVGSWGYDNRTTGHTLDQGFSSDAEKTGEFDPVFLVTDMLSVAALSFFLPAPALQRSEERVTYFLWTEAIPLALAPLAFCSLLNGHPGRAYQATRRPKAFGKGGAFKYWPAATLIATA